MNTALTDDASDVESAQPLERPAAAPPLDDPDAGTWFVAFTKSNRHYDFVRLAARAGIEYFLPLAERVTTCPRGKRRVTTYPLFGAYCFFRGTPYTPAEALATLMLRGVITVNNQSRIRNDLANLERALSSRDGRRMERCDLAVTGRKVRITEGPLQGLYGTVLQRGRDTLLVIQVEGMFGGAVMEIGAERLEPAD